MISYRKLAMRVLGHPLRVPTNTPRPASHRVTALALTAAMVAGMAAPAYAGTYYIDNNGGDITVTKDKSGTYVKHSGNPTATKDSDGNIIIKGGKRSEDTTLSRAEQEPTPPKTPTPAPVLPKAAPPAAALPKAAPLQPLPPNPRRPRSK